MVTLGSISMSNANAEQIKKFIFTSKNRSNCNNTGDQLEIVIPELLQAGYSFYTWPSAPILAWFLWERRQELVDKNILEIGSGTALPGILAAKCGAKVTLTDSSTLPKSLAHLHRCCVLNGLTPDASNIKVEGLTWGLFLNTSILNVGQTDIILGSDCFYDPTVFEDILVTVSFILSNNIHAKFLCTYQERSSDWSIEALLKKWDLKCTVINIQNVGVESGVNIQELMGDQTIHLLEITHN